MALNRSKFVTIQLILIFLMVSVYNHDNSLRSIRSEETIQSDSFENLRTTQPIILNSNSALDLYAQSNNLTGDGSYSNPYLLDSVMIDATTDDHAISLYQIDRYLIIRSSVFLGGIINTIKLQEVANLHLFNNTINRAQIPTRNDCSGNRGIQIDASANLIIEQNLIENTRAGIQLTWGNVAFLNFRGNITLQNNTIHNIYNGILISNILGSEATYRGNIIQYNFVTGASSNGIYLQGGANHNIIFGNKLENASRLIIYSNFNTISHNELTMDISSLILGNVAVNNTVTNNTVHSQSYGMMLGSLSTFENNNITFNNFFGGMRSIGSVTADYNNKFDRNFYSDHTLTDSDGDGIADLDFLLGAGI